MSKFLKFIVHFIVICTILCVVALAVPPFLGVTTEIMDDSGAETNLALGSVTYAIPEKVEDVSAGTPILVNGEAAVYRYNIVSLDLENHTGVVIDPNGTESINVSIKNRLPKVVLTVPYLGYLLIATESIEGLIILGLAVLFLIILYVIAELWKKDSSEEYDDEEDDSEYIKSAKELKREEKERERRMRDEDRELLKNDKKRKKEEKKNRKIIKTGGFVDEVYEDEMDEEEEQPPRRRANVQSATREAHELLKKEIAAATAEEPVSTEEEKPERPQTKKNKKASPAQGKSHKSAKPKKKPAVEELPEVEVKRMAIPVRSAAQLADMAKKEGDAPEIVKDEITKVTLFDYSDIISEDDEDYDEE